MATSAGLYSATRAIRFASCCAIRRLASLVTVVSGVSTRGDLGWLDIGGAVDRRPRRRPLMSILLWYFPYAMFSGACDVVLAESGTRMSSERRADSAERGRDTDETALGRTT